MRLRSVIIDDEVHASDALKAMLLAGFDDKVEIVGVCNNAAHGEACIRSTKPQLVFLDVEMPNKNGIDLLSSIPDPEFEVIFTTAYHHYAIAAIKLNALDYLLKPYSIRDLGAALNKCIKRVENKERTISDYHALYQSLKQTTGPKKIALNTGKQIEFVEANDIISIEAKRSYSEFSLAMGKKILVSKPLKDFEEMLNHLNFFRVHHSYLINLRLVKTILNENDTVIMNGNIAISISRRKKQELIDALREV